ncbi:11103_t:CDS:2 [Racocetra persica]|uniref:11103_t:CDS:1 n=1 Tax=Racocetra persica TaxID=160502 RepID=A0ACA9L0T9_9GLOM|nr:11103_t:CDS:2 [Racocetra persica]
MVAKDFRLSSFFDSIYNASLPENRSSKYLDKLDKKLAVECYIICSNQNAKLTAFKKDISLFVDLIGVFTEAIDALSHAGITISRRHLDREKTAIADNHSHKVTSYLENKKTNSYYMRRMAKTFNDQLHYEISLDKKLENMTLHKYDDYIKKRQEERKMKDTILLDFFELSLKDMDSYIIALKETLSGFDDVFVVQKKSTYADNDHLALLTKKVEVFLFETFGNIYRKLGQSSIIKSRNKKITYKLASLDFIVNKKQMLLGFSSKHLPAYDKCDHCHKLLRNRTGKSFMVIAYGHGYHESCFTISLNKKYLYCENVLKLGIRNNVSSLLSRLSKLDIKKLNLKEFIDADDDSP